MNALADIAPSGAGGWLLKAWYELPVFAVLLAALGPIVLLVLAPRLLSGLAADGPGAAALPRAAEAVVATAGVACLAFAVVDLAGVRFTLEADVWAVAAAAWLLPSWALSLRLRRGAARAAAPA